MYSSPVELIYKDAQYRLEEDIFKAIQKVDIKVNRDELLKALAYDRHQYEKGYADALAERPKGKWVEKWSGHFKTNVPRCSLCSSASPFKYNYCPTCGAEMKQ